MSEPFVAEIRIFAGNFAPRNWAFCNGQTLPISQNTALFSIIGTTYGGDGRTTVGLPNLQGRAPMHVGNGPGLTPRNREGISGGTTTASIDAVPTHSHTARANSAPGNDNVPTNNHLARSFGFAAYQPATGPQTDMAADKLTEAGNGSPESFNIVQPYLVMHFIIALTGLFPSRS